MVEADSRSPVATASETNVFRLFESNLAAGKCEWVTTHDHLGYFRFHADIVGMEVSTRSRCSRTRHGWLPKHAVAIGHLHRQWREITTEWWTLGGVPSD